MESLLPLYRGDGFFADVPKDAVDARDPDNLIAHFAEDVKRDLRHRGCHGVYRVDRADDDRPAHIALALTVNVFDTG